MKKKLFGINFIEKNVTLDDFKVLKVVGRGAFGKVY